jgi:TolB-like protein
MSGVYDDRYSAEAGRLIGARYVLTGKVLRFDDVLTRQIEVQVQVIDAFTGQVHLSEVVRVNKTDLERGSTRAQLLERSAERAAARVAGFDPHGR